MTDEADGYEWERSPEELYEATIDAYPPGRFAGVEPLLRRFCALAFEAERLAIEEHQQPISSERSSELFWQHMRVTHELIDLADALHLWPTEENEVPVRLS
jgi:hypothetical protein